MRGEKRGIRGKTSNGRVENQQTQSTYQVRKSTYQVSYDYRSYATAITSQSTYDTGCGSRTRATLVEGKCSHH